VYDSKAERAEVGMLDVAHGPQPPVMVGNSGAAAARGAMVAITVVNFMMNVFLSV